jgi:hypothetical protein
MCDCGSRASCARSLDACAVAYTVSPASIWQCHTPAARPGGNLARSSAASPPGASVSVTVAVAVSATVSVMRITSCAMPGNTSRRTSCSSSRNCDPSVSGETAEARVGWNCASACCLTWLGELCAVAARSFRRSSSAVVNQRVTAFRPCGRFAARQRPSTPRRQPRGAGERRAHPTPSTGRSGGLGASAISHASASVGL